LGVKTPYREAAELDTAPKASYLMPLSFAVAYDTEEFRRSSSCIDSFCTFGADFDEATPR
jgi:hypothetical protein